MVRKFCPIFFGCSFGRGSSSTNPTVAGQNVNFTGTATDADGNSWKLVVCKTNSVTPNITTPSCPGGNWCADGTWRGSGSQSSCSYTTQSSDAGSQTWYAFACDNHSSQPSCSSSSQGSGDNGSPFYVVYYPPCAAPASGDWTVSQSCVITNEDQNVAGNTIIANTGTLDLRGESTIKFLERLDKTVSASTDDAHDYPATSSYYESNVAFAMGKDSSGYDAFAGFRFTNINIPQGSVITSAKVSVRSYEANSNYAYLKIYADNVDNSPTFSSSNKPSQRTATAAQVDWDITSSWSANLWYDSPDISSVIRGAVNRAGWSSGNAISIIIHDDGGGASQRRVGDTFDGGSDKAPKLTITFKSNNARYIYLNSGGSNLYLSKDASIGGTGDTGTGPVGTWSSTTSLPQAMREIGVEVYNGYIYLTGGMTTTDVDFSSVYYAPILANGTIGSWTATSSLPKTFRSHGSFVHNGYIYTIGGYDGIPGPNAFINDVYYAPINSNGSVGSWTATTSHPEYCVWDNDGVMVYQNYIYTLGGYCGTYSSTKVWFAPINSNGTIGAWTETTSIPNWPTRNGFSYRGYVYAMDKYMSAPCNAYKYAQINSNATLGSWQTGPTQPNCRAATAIVRSPGGYVYRLGGHDGTNVYSTVYYGQVNFAGVPGSWSETTSLPVARAWIGRATYKNYIYVLGGQDCPSSLSCIKSDVWYAPRL